MISFSRNLNFPLKSPKISDTQKYKEIQLYTNMLRDKMASP